MAIPSNNTATDFEPQQHDAWPGGLAVHSGVLDKGRKGLLHKGLNASNQGL
jgi:hypothetical protein